MDFLVTISAIMNYLKKAREAQDKLDQATKTMNAAADEVLAQWSGEAADAFRQEQEQLKGFLNSLLNVGRNFSQVVEEVARKYEEMEDNIRSKITG